MSLFAVLFAVGEIIKFKLNIDLRYFSGYLGYTILGYYLVFKVQHINRLIPFLLFLVGISITILGTYIQTRVNGQFYKAFYDFLSPNVILASIGLFLIIETIEIKNKLLNKAISCISQYSYGIYLSHVFVLIYLSEMNIDWSFINPIVGTPIVTFICVLISLLITWLINKLPYDKYISG